MFVQLSYLLLAIIGLGFLIFIHELGHYIVARRQGMKVEVFSIGFGTPLYSWISKSGVRWQIGWLPFGGYARIAGMQREGSREPYEIAEGFYSKTPAQRILVALAGPAVNIIFAIVAFFIIWSSGGRDKTFSEFTHRIGWVDPKSALYEQGVRPGDVIQSYDGHPFDGIKNLQIASITKDDVNRIQGYKIDYFSGRHSQFDYTLKTYPIAAIPQEKLLTIGVMTPARYFIYDPSHPLLPGSPMFSSGIEGNDRLVWADGEMLFSFDQLKSLINESTAFLTVQRGSKVLQTKVPRVHLDDLKMTPVQRAELDDWQHEADIKGRLQDLYFIPYLLSPNGVVEMRLNFIDQNDQEKAFQRCQRCAYFHPLQEGDVILAVDGRPVSSSYDLLNFLQTRHVLLIVQRDPAAIQKVDWNAADRDFEDRMNLKDLRAIVSSIGTSKSRTASGHLHLLGSVSPKPLIDVPLPVDMQAQQAESLAQSRKMIESISDPQKREEQLKELERSQKNVILGIAFKDRAVIYNPTPTQQFVDCVKDTWFALSGLISGSVAPKYMQGPIGIVQVIHQGWMHGAKEAIFLMAVISLNLGIFNLLPIPVLDGGHICFSLYEGLTKRRVKSRTMERLVIPFVALLIGLIVYITFQDLLRIFTRFF